MTVPNIIVARLRAIRIERGISQVGLSKGLGYDRFTINRWENGKMSPTLARLIDWSAALGYDLLLKPTAELLLSETIPFPDKRKLMAGR